MRKILGLICIALGVALVGLAIALPSYVYPRVAKAPENPDTTQVAQGTGITVLLPRGLQEGGPRILTDKTVTVTRDIDGQKVEGADEDNPFYRLAFKADVEGEQPPLLQAYVEGAGFDGRTGEANNKGPDYVIQDEGAQPEQITHEGLMFKFPFGTEQKDYPFWDVNIRQTATARYDGTETIDGLLTYRFVQPIPDTTIGQEDVPGTLIGLPDQPVVKADRIYATTRTLWVEPNTGAIIKGSEQVNQRLAAEGRTIPVITGNLEYTPATVQANVEEYKSSASSLAFVRRTGPIGGWILGPILIAVGVVLFLLARRREERDDDDEWDDGPDYRTV